MTEEKNSNQAVGLELADLVLVLKLLQVVSKRGAIQADEMATVGNLYTRLEAFVKAHTPAEPVDKSTESVQNHNPKESNNG